MSETGDRCLVLEHLVQGETLLKGQSPDVRRAHPDGKVRAGAAAESSGRPQTVAVNEEQGVVGVAFAAYQLIHERQIDIVVQCVECANQAVRWVVFVEYVPVEYQVDRGGVVVDGRVGLRFEGLLVADVVRGNGHELVIDAVFEGEGEGTVGFCAADGYVGLVVDGDVDRNIMHAGTARVILCAE